MDEPGYDDRTGLLYDPRGVEFLPIPAKPTKEDALVALATLRDGLLCGFPFVADADRAVALAGILTACVRRTLDHAPLFGIDATAQGTGKGKLADTISIIGSGEADSINLRWGRE